jgi:hypothetical protein
MTLKSHKFWLEVAKMWGDKRDAIDDMCDRQRGVLDSWCKHAYWAANDAIYGVNLSPYKGVVWKAETHTFNFEQEIDANHFASVMRFNDARVMVEKSDSEMPYTVVIHLESPKSLVWWHREPDIMR